jgi:hypothetical protein
LIEMHKPSQQEIYVHRITLRTVAEYPEQRKHQPHRSTGKAELVCLIALHVQGNGTILR